MFVLELFAVSLELRHELGAGVSIIATPRLPAACSKPREAQLEAGLHTAAHLPRGVAACASPDPGYSFARRLAAGKQKESGPCRVVGGWMGARAVAATVSQWASARLGAGVAHLAGRRKLPPDDVADVDVAVPRSRLLASVP